MGGADVISYVYVTSNRDAAPEVLKAVKDALERLKQRGIEPIDD